MSLEIEKRFINFDYNEIKGILSEKCDHIGSFLYTFTSYKGTKPGQSIRVRDEGSKITFTVKQKNENNYDTEWEVAVSNYKMLDLMLTEMGISKRYTMQKFREIYKTKNGNSEIIFDHYPALPPYIEIESISEDELLETIKTLNLKEEKDFSARTLYYDLYGIQQERESDCLTFSTAEDVLSQYITKNKTDFLEKLNSQKEQYL